ncbi:hypothetical protein D9619_003380 [Psilocybe cf. subviscida]|uniref:Chitin-binding type-3 domain-containing protein n=1 Tax=Psilocybe cf. subviscida TaxID=2480587 RepID=A0A8H5AVK0_9AGAR|nr:hypothetical protein D9619_003380 [Psilocybe cf. subviscida]
MPKNRFYNNYCGLQNFGQASNWDFGIWDIWARTTSPNKNIKVYIGAPASSSAAGSGYVPISTLTSIAVQMRKSFPSFGGVMMWDASQAYANNRYDLATKNALSAAGGTGFTFPACSAPAFSAGTTYSGGAQVSYGGYIWQAKWSASVTPAGNVNNDWSAISACGGAAVPTSSSPTSTTKPTSSSSSTTKPVTTSTPTATPTSSGSCAGIASWSSSVAYVGGSQVVYNGHLWTAKWWSQADVPGGAAADWTDNGPCSSSSQAPKTVSAKAQAASSSKPVAKVLSSAKESAATAPAADKVAPSALNSRFFRL